MPEVNQPNSDSDEAKKTNGNTFRAAYALSAIGLRRIVVVALFIFIVLLLVGIFLPNMKERVKFLTESTLSLLILLVVAVQAYIYTRQWEVMQEQKRMMTIGERAYLGIKDVKVNTPIMNNTLVVNALFFNGGRTPAINVDRKFQIGLVKETRQFDWNAIPDLAEASFSILPAGAERWVTFPHVPITPEKFADFEAGTRRIHVSGELRFTDYMGIKQIFEFDMTCESRDNGSFKERYQRQYDAN